MDQKIYKKNRKALKEKYPEIYEKLQEYESQDEKESDTLTCRQVDTRESAKALVVQKDNREIRLNSKYYPLREAKQWANQFNYQHISVNAIIFGLGNGIFIRELLERLEKDSVLCIVEPDFRIFSILIKEIDFSDIIRNKKVKLYFYRADKYEALDGVAAFLSWSNLGTTIQANHPGYEKVYEELFYEYRVELVKLYEAVIADYNSLKLFSNSAVYNIVHNLQYVEQSNYVDELTGAFPEDYPAVVVSAGPSLMKNIEQLHRLKDKAFILVVDTAVKVMEENNIPYDAIVIIDPTKPAEFLTDFPSCKEKTLFCMLESKMEILHFHTGRKIWLPNCYWLERTYKKHDMPFGKHRLGGSVATMAADIARIMGFKTIILVGQDLAYLGESTHAGRANAMGEERGYASKWIDGIDGNKVRSRWDWIHYLQWFEEFAEMYEGEITLVDATEGGALIHGSVVMTLAEVIEKYAKEEFSFQDYMNHLPRTFEVNDFEPIAEEMKLLRDDIAKLPEKCEKGLKYLKIFEEKGESLTDKEMDEALQKCSKLNQEFATNHGFDIIEYGISEKLYNKFNKINHVSEDEKKNKSDTARMLMDYYEAVKEVSTKITEDFKSVMPS